MKVVQELSIKRVVKDSIKEVNDSGKDIKYSVESFGKPRDKPVQVPENELKAVPFILPAEQPAKEPVKKPVTKALPRLVEQFISDPQPLPPQLPFNETNTLSAADKKASAESFATARSDAGSFVSFTSTPATPQEKAVDNTASAPKTQSTAEVNIPDVDPMLCKAKLTISAKGPRIFRKSDLSIVDLEFVDATSSGGKKGESKVTSSNNEELSGSLELLDISDAIYSDDEFNEIVDGWMLV
jgi:hypothetical protein